MDIIKTVLKLLSPKRYAKYCGVRMGQNVFWATRYVPTEAYLIDIGDHTQITEGVKLFTHGGGNVARYKYPDFDLFGKITIGEWSYIGTDSLIMPGVTIGNHVLVAAGSVVTKSIPDGCVVAGNPAKVICSVEDYIENNLRYNVNSKKMNRNAKKSFLLNLDKSYFIVKQEIEMKSSFNIHAD